MKHKLITSLAVSLLGAVFLTQSIKAQPLVLTGTNYFQNFDDIANNFPGEWICYTNAKATQLGTIVGVTTDPTASVNAWAQTSYAFKNFASTNDTLGGTNFNGNEPLSVQSTTANRVLGVRMTGAAGVEPTAINGGPAFALKINDTMGFGNFSLNLDFMLLNVQPRSATFVVDYGVGNSPSSFIPVATNVFLSTASSPVGSFGVSNLTVSFGTALNNQPGPVYIRIACLTPTAGSGNRPSVGIDNFSLSYTNVPLGVVPPTIVTGIGTNTAFTGESATLSVGVSGTAPFNYQWYFPDLNTPIGGAIGSSYSQSLLTTDQSGNYYVIVSNSEGSATNMGVLNVVSRIPIATNIAYLRTLIDSVNFAPYDTTNLYVIEGTVITRTNMTTAGNASFWIEDTNSLVGIDVFVGGSTDIRPAVGDRVQVTGPLGIFQGVLEMNLSSSNPNHSVVNLGSDYPLPPAKTFLFSSAADVWLMETNIEGSLVVVPSVYLPGGGAGNFVSGSTLLMTNLNGETFQLYIDSRLTDVIGQPIPAGLTSITGYMTQFKSSPPYTGGYELVPTAYSQIQPGVPPGSPTLSIQLSGGNAVLTWSDPTFNLQSSTNIAGPYGDVGQPSGYSEPVTDVTKFFRLFKP